MLDFCFLFYGIIKEEGQGLKSIRDYRKKNLIKSGMKIFSPNEK